MRHKDESKSRVSTGGEPTLAQVRPPGLSIAALAAGVIVVAIVVVIAHWPALSAKALCFDDDEYLVDNRLVQNPSGNSARRFLTEVLEPSTVHGYYQPLTMISLMLDCALGGGPDRLMPFHRTSLILHVLNTALVLVLLYQLFGSVWAASLVALLFGVHPMTVETIPWVGERKTLLATFFALLALLAYVRYARSGQWRFYGASLAAFVLALMSKPTSTPLPVCMLLMDFWPLRRLGRRAAIEKVPFLAIAAISAYITYMSQTLTAETALAAGLGPGRIPYILCHNVIFYLRKIVWPTNLSSHYAFPHPLDMSDANVLAGVVGTAILIPALIVSLRWTRALLAGVLFFFVMILPALGVIGFTNVIAADKFAYLPSFGLMMPVAWFLARFAEQKRRPGLATRKIGATGVAAVLAVMAVSGTRAYLRQWRDTETLFRYMVSRAPEAAAPRIQLALELIRQGPDRLDEAIELYRKAITLAPAYERTYYNLGIALARQNKLAEAIEQYRVAIRLKRDFAEAHNNLGNALLEAGDVEAARLHLSEAIRYKHDYADAHYNLANLLVGQKELAEAAGHYEQAIKVDPNHASAHGGLGNVFWLQGNRVAAIEQYREALKINPDHAFSHLNLAELLYGRGEIESAIGHYREALRCRPDWWQAADSLALIYAAHQDVSIRNPPEAVRLAEHACRVTGRRQPVALSTLAQACGAAGRIEEAAATAREAIEAALASGNAKLADDIREQLKQYLPDAPSHSRPKRDNP